METTSLASTLITEEISKIVDDKFKQLDADAAEFYEKRKKEIAVTDAKLRDDAETHIKKLRDEVEVKIKDVEDKVTRDVRTKVFYVALTVVVGAAGVMLTGSFAAMRDVNNSVIALQNIIINTQDRIKEADKALTDQIKQLAAASSNLTTKTADLDAADAKLREETTKLNAVELQLDKARTEYERISKAPK